ncbi:MAG TPA: DUF1800 domain-containing protein [Streptosporangiaceae bacterium]|jgi:uncharacterized protein (DUF1800 family)|nr:DUF1800 domain-containing protein [Streptosporangiaceae bacterium]
MADRAMVRLVQRTGFGAHPDEIAAVAGLEFADAVDRRLRPAGADSGAVATPPPRLESPRRPEKNAGKVDPEARKRHARAIRQQSQLLILWWLERMVAAEHPWTEKRTLLWHGHWATSIQKVRSAELMLRQNETLRRLGAGDFGVLARALVMDPALMIWLDAGGNTAEAPNENLARELMELFTLGVGHYTEQDVRQAARALTGWRMERRAGDIRFVPRRHTSGTQTILGRTADFTPESLVDLLIGRPESARHLAGRFWAWLVRETPPTPQSLDRIVRAYGADRDTAAMFRAMLTDPAFTAADSVLVKQPVEWLAGALRALRLRPGRLPEAQRRQLINQLNGLGQVPFRPPSVGGWPSGAAWLTTSAAQTRIRIAAMLTRYADLKTIADEPAAGRADALAHVLGVPGWTGRTRAALSAAGGDPGRLVIVGLCAPEYVVNG